MHCVRGRLCEGDLPFQITVHDGEEDLEEQVDGVYQHRQQVQPCLARHCRGRCVLRRAATVYEGGCE